MRELCLLLSVAVSAIATAACHPTGPACSDRGTPLDRAAITDALDDFQRDLLASERTELVEQPAPFLTCGRFVRVEHRGHNHPTVFYVGSAPGLTRLLRRGPDVVSFAREVGVSLADEASRTAYVAAYFRVQRAYPFLLGSIADVPFTVPRTEAELELDPEHEDFRSMIVEDIQKRRAFEDGAGTRIAPLRLAGTPPWRGTLYAISSAREMMAFEIALQASGELDVRPHVVASDLPVTQISP